MAELTPEQKEKVKAVVGMVVAFGEAIRDMGPEGMVSGTLYGVAMEKGISLEMYSNIIATLKNARLVSERGHVLRWIGPNQKA